MDVDGDLVDDSSYGEELIGVVGEEGVGDNPFLLIVPTFALRVPTPQRR